jgi:hypothetical protein
MKLLGVLESRVFLPSWNVGILERWNSGFNLKEYDPF